jgi:isoleucyl-tRNA synthetase
MQGKDEQPVTGYTKEVENKKSAIATREEAILRFWKENDTFNKSLKKDAPKGNYVFYDGPPFATGLPHYGHILGSTAKDVIGRYQTMQGFRVPRRWGWDCHGLPIENIVEKDLGISGRKAIEEYGIEKFTEYARSKVLTYVGEWKKTVDRIGRWVDFDNSYKTMDNSFIESVWWALSELNKKKLIYEGVRVLAYCPRCETPIANSEIAMDNSYKDITDISVYVKFELVDELGTFLIAWTTTPWSLPGDTAIAVNKDIVYVKVLEKETGKKYIFAKDVFEKMKPKFTGETEVVEEFKGEKLVGLTYVPPFDYYKGVGMPNKENIWKVWHADFVTADQGTGIAHEAPAFGEDDMNLAKEFNLPWIIHVTPDGRFKDEVTDFAGVKVKPKEDHQSGDVAIIKHLAHTGMLFAKEKIIHSYPHCYRCDTPLLYYALPSWFVNIQNVKTNMLTQAESINWVPAHLKDGRFKNTMESAPDWTISRNRFWASPLPIWKSQKGEILFVPSVEELQKYTVKSGNRYFVMRHGQTNHNLNNLVSTVRNSGSHLTEEGKNQVRMSAETLKDKNIDVIFVSPFNRTIETEKIVAEVLGLTEDHIVVDDRLHEMSLPMYEGKTWSEYHEAYPKTVENFDKAPEGNESYLDMKRRTMSFIFEIEAKYKGKNVLVVTHGAPAWLLTAGARMLDTEATLNLIRERHDFHYFENAEIQELPFTPFPHNANFELDLHRPYIDSVVLEKDGEVYKRIPEVIDCWFESGSMPFAQDHYPFERPQWKEENFPAGFISEYIPQTRTWFYYTHVISTILFGTAAYKNVVATGSVLAEDGQKMSKSKNNFPDPWILFDKFGVDALRFYLVSSTVMKGEDVSFFEKGVQDVSSKIVSRLDNVVAFYELYRDTSLEKTEETLDPKNVLDQWIYARLNQLVVATTSGMDGYDIALATRPFELFIEDLSTWYLRRSRDRLKDGDVEAKKTLYVVLKTVARLLSPFTPFISEDIWQRLKTDSDAESVHLTEWPKAGEVDDVSMAKMNIVRNLVSIGLKERQKAGIPVRQPLNKISFIPASLQSYYLEILRDELNVKQIIEDSSISGEVELDTHITLPLRQEGQYRELVRAVQDMRKKMGLNASDAIELAIETSVEGQEILNQFKTEMMKTVGAKELKIAENAGTEVKIDELVFKVEIVKI